MASTKTEHLTSLSFNLTDMKAQLDSIPASVQEAAIKAQEAWNNNFKMGEIGGTGSGSNSSGGGSDDAEAASLSATKSRLESLLLSGRRCAAGCGSRGSALAPLPARVNNAHEPSDGNCRLTEFMRACM